MCIETPIGLVASAIVRVLPHAGSLACIYRLEEGLGLYALRANDLSDRASVIASGFSLALTEPIPSAEAMVYCEIDQDEEDPPSGWITPVHCKTGSPALDELPDHRCAVLFGDELPVHERIVHVHVVRVDVRAPQRMSPMLRPLAGLTEESLCL